MASRTAQTEVDKAREEHNRRTATPVEKGPFELKLEQEKAERESKSS